MFFPCNVVCTGNSKMKLYKSTHVTICYRKEVCSMMHHSPRYNRVDQKSFLLLFEAYVLQGLTKSPSESTYSGLFFGHSEKNSSTKKLKTQANPLKLKQKFLKKLKNCQVQLSSVGGKFSNTTIFCLNCTIQYLTSDQSI